MSATREHRTALELTDLRGEPRVDSRLMAHELGNQHKAVMTLVDRYARRFRRWGILPFQMEKVPGTGRGRPERFALLNENQAIFLLTLSRNSSKVVDLKENLVAAFAEAREGKRLHGLGLFQRRLEIERRDATSAARACFGSRLMHDRRRELPAIQMERELLDAAMQQPLFLLPQTEEA